MSFALSLGNEEVTIEYKPSEKVENFVKNLKNKIICQKKLTYLAILQVTVCYLC